MTSTVTRWRRRRGLALFGYAQENFHQHHQLLLVWGLGRPARLEVYRWPVGTGSTEADSARGDAPFGSREAYRRIRAHAELVYAGHDWEAARAAFNGRYDPAGGQSDGAFVCGTHLHELRQHRVAQHASARPRANQNRLVCLPAVLGLRHAGENQMHSASFVPAPP